mmetsp:Transcript_40349/g.86649  ORF Transcript_40349/g.86649 Transcript_40349/m.86649 type:complete len:123 (+) Transcript_40349:424-792(+)
MKLESRRLSLAEVAVGQPKLLAGAPKPGPGPVLLSAAAAKSQQQVRRSVPASSERVAGQLVSDEFLVHTLHGHLARASALLDAISVVFVALVVGGMILGLRHVEERKRATTVDLTATGGTAV